MASVIYDAESSVELRDPDAAAVTSTTTGTAIDFNLDAANGFAVILNVQSVDRTDADETYVLTIESLDSAGANQFTQLTAPSITESGNYRFLIDGETAAKFDTDAAKIRAVMTIGGTSPSIKYGCWVMPAYGVSGRA